MKIFALLFLAILFFSHGVHAQVMPTGVQVGCNKQVLYDASTNGSTKLITGLTGAKIYVCGYYLWAGGTATVKLAQGTGTNCGTGTAAMTPAYSLTTQTGINDSEVLWRGLSTSLAQDLCITTSAGVAVQAMVYYSQFIGGP